MGGVHADGAPLQPCPYRIEESWSCPYCRPAAVPGECQVVAVVRPGGWIPFSAFETPEDGWVVEVIRRKTPVDRARTLIEHYNTLSLREGGSTWAGIPTAAAVLGRKVNLRAMPRED